MSEPRRQEPWRGGAAEGSTKRLFPAKCRSIYTSKVSTSSVERVRQDLLQQQVQPASSQDDNAASWISHLPKCLGFNPASANDLGQVLCRRRAVRFAPLRKSLLDFQLQERPLLQQPL